MAYTEVLTGHGVTAEQWDSMLYSEYTGQIWMKHLMGTGDTAPIQVSQDLTKTAGDAINIPIRSQLQGGTVRGNAKGEGNEGRVDFYNFRMTIDNVRQLVRVDDVPMSEKRVAFSVLQGAKDALVEKNKYLLEDDIITALCTVSDAAGGGKVRGKTLYGASDGNWNATHATALLAVDNAADQLSTSMISIAKRKAQIPTNATAKIRPMRVQSGKLVEEWFCFLGHTLSIRDLVENDAAWKNAQLNIPPNANRDSPLFTGSWFKGSWNGVLIYEFERLPLIASTIQVSHNMLLGAQAAAVAWGQRTKFGEEMKDVGHDRIYETHEIRGISKLIFDRNSIDSSITNEDNGQVNVFAAAVAD